MNTQQTKIYYNKDLKLGSLQPNTTDDDKHFSNEMSALFLNLLNDDVIPIEGYNPKKFLSVLYQLDQLARKIDVLVDEKKLFINLTQTKTSNMVFELAGNELDEIFQSLVQLSVYEEKDRKSFYEIIIKSIKANTSERHKSYVVGMNKFNVDVFGYLYHPIMSIVKKSYSGTDTKNIANILKTYFHIVNFCDDLVDLKSDIENQVPTPLTNFLHLNSSNKVTINKVLLHNQISIWEYDLRTVTLKNLSENTSNVILLSLFNMNNKIEEFSESEAYGYTQDIVPPIFCYY